MYQARVSHLLIVLQVVTILIGGQASVPGREGKSHFEWLQVE